jgi:ADP-ribose pyrophosphatase
MFAFAATDLTHVGQKLEEDESIRVEVVPATRAIEMVASGELRDAKSMLAILLAERAGFL